MQDKIEAADDWPQADEATASRRYVLTGAAGLAASVSVATPLLAQSATPPDLRFFNPDTLSKPLGQYSHMTRVKASEFLFIAGQVAVDTSVMSAAMPSGPARTITLRPCSCGRPSSQ